MTGAQGGDDHAHMPDVTEKGLTAAEVRDRVERGQTNEVKSSTSRSLADIVRANVFTLFNGIIFTAMVMVLITGSWKDAVFGLVILINTGIGIVTELRAKRTLDKLSILIASDYLVRRMWTSRITASCSATACGSAPASRSRATPRFCIPGDWSSTSP